MISKRILDLFCNKKKFAKFKFFYQTALRDHSLFHGCLFNSHSQNSWKNRNRKVIHWNLYKADAFGAWKKCPLYGDVCFIEIPYQNEYLVKINQECVFEVNWFHKVKKGHVDFIIFDNPTLLKTILYCRPCYFFPCFLSRSNDIHYVYIFNNLRCGRVLINFSKYILNESLSKLHLKVLDNPSINWLKSRSCVLR